MRTPDGYTNAVDSATALARGDLGPVAANPNLTNDDYFSCDSAGLPPAPTAATDAQWLNAVTEEMQYILDMGSVGTPGGLSPSTTDNAQLAEVLAGAPGIYSHASDTTEVSTPNTRVVLAGAGNVTGASSMVAASAGAALAIPKVTGSQSVAEGVYAPNNQPLVSGNRSALRATDATAGTWAVSGNGSVAEGCKNGVSVAGNQCAATTSDNPTIGAGADLSRIDACGSGCSNEGEACHVHASQVCTIDNASYRSAISASADCNIAGAAEAFIGGCYKVDVTGDQGAAVSVDSSGGTATTVDLPTTICVASDGNVPSPSAAGTPPAAGAATKSQMYGGSGGVRTWRIDSYGAGTDVAGTARFNGGAVTGGADLAEYFPTHDGEVPRRRIVTRRRRSAKLAGIGDSILGVTSVRPGFVGNSGGEQDAHVHGPDWCLVGLLGQVEVEVDDTVSNELIDLHEKDGGALFIEPGENGVGTANLFGKTRLEAMEMIEPGLCLCLIR